MGEVASGASEHQLVRVGGIVELALHQIWEVGCHRGDLVHDAGSHLVAQQCLTGPGGGDRSVEGEGAGYVLPRWCQLRIAQGRNRQIERRGLGNQASDAPFEVTLHVLGGPEEGYVVAEITFVELVVGMGILREAAEREVDLEVRRSVVDGIDPP